MSNIILDKEHMTEVLCAGRMFSLAEGDGGSLYIEAVDGSSFEITVADDGEGVIKATGQWATITFMPSKESS